MLSTTWGGWCFADKDALLAFLNSETLLAQVREKQRTVRFPQAMVTNDEVISCFAGPLVSVGSAVLQARYSTTEAVKAQLTAAGIGVFNRLKVLVKAVEKKVRG